MDIILTKKTSAEWYQLEKRYDILDPDGWRMLPNGKDYWFHQPIVQTEYDRKLYMSTVKTYTEKHGSPYLLEDINPH